MNTPPGMQIFSKEWFDWCLPKDIPAPLRLCAEKICSSFELGNTTHPQEVVNLIRSALLDQFNYTYVVEKDNTEYTVNELGFSSSGEFSYFGESEADACLFSDNDILQKKPK